MRIIYPSYGLFPGFTNYSSVHGKTKVDHEDEKYPNQNKLNLPKITSYTFIQQSEKGENAIH